MANPPGPRNRKVQSQQPSNMRGTAHDSTLVQKGVARVKEFVKKANPFNTISEELSKIEKGQ